MLVRENGAGCAREGLSPSRRVLGTLLRMRFDQVSVRSMLRLLPFDPHGEEGALAPVSNHAGPGFSTGTNQ